MKNLAAYMVAAGCLLGGISSFAATLNVPAQYSTIVEAVAAAEDGDTVLVAAGTHVVNEALTLSKSVKVVGAGPEQTFVTREGTSYKSKKLFILTNEGALVDNLTVKDVYAQDVGGTSGAIFEFPNTTGRGALSRLVVTGCTAGSSGAGYVCYIGSSASATVTDVVFRENTLRDSGGSGVIYANNPAAATVERCAFVRNTGFTTGALRVNSRCKVINCTFADNRTNFTVPTNARGGALYLESIGANMSFSNCVFFSDHAWYDTSDMAPEVNQSASSIAARFADCAWDSRVTAVGANSISITESAFTDVYSGDFSPHANSPLVTAKGTLGALAASTATGPAYTPSGASEITLAANASINDAIKAAPAGQVINLSAGIYSVTGTIWIAKGITLKGAGRDKTFLMREGTSYDSWAYLRLEHPECVVSDLTISNVTAAANYQAGVLFVTARGGTFRDCRITKCKGAGSGSGALIGLAGGNASVMSRCHVNANTLFGSSNNCIFWMWGGVLDNSLVCANTTITRGCLSLRGPTKVTNCTFADNSCRNTADSQVCAGVFWHDADNFNCEAARVVNTIFTRGSAPKDSSTGAPEWYRYGGTEAKFKACFENCAWGSGVPVIGANSVSVTDDGFVDAANLNYHLKTSSAAFEKGFNDARIGEKDLDGNDRVQGDLPDIGCYEAEAGKFSVEIKIAPTAGFTGSKFHCTPVITGLKDGAVYTCKWTFHNETVAEADIVSTSSEYDQTFVSAGVRSVSLEVFDAEGKSLGTAEPQLNYLNVGVTECYLADPADESVTPAYPYATAGTAAKVSLAELVGAAVPSQTIHVLEGCVNIGGKVDISGLKVIGQGWNKTILTNAPYVATADVDPFLTLSKEGSLLDNLCISNVETYSNGPSLVNLGALGGTVSRVKFAHCRGGNASNGYLVGLYATNAILANCWLDDNEVQQNGNCGAVYVEKGIVESTHVDGTRGLHVGGGLIAAGQDATFRNCTVTRCKAGPNWAEGKKFAGLVFMDRNDLTDGTFTCGRFLNCISACNDSCALAGDGGSAWRNCSDRPLTLALSVSNCAFSVDAKLVGTNTRAVDPSRDFRNVERGDFRPKASGGLVDAGQYADWMATATDLGGKPRATGRKTVDIGCYQANHCGFQLIVR